MNDDMPPLDEMSDDMPPLDEMSDDMPPLDEISDETKKILNSSSGICGPCTIFEKDGVFSCIGDGKGNIYNPTFKPYPKIHINLVSPYKLPYKLG